MAGRERTRWFEHADPDGEVEPTRVDRLLEPAWRWWAVFRAAQAVVVAGLLVLVLLGDGCQSSGL